MPKCKACGAPVTLAPDGDPRYQPEQKVEELSDENRPWLKVMREKHARMLKENRNG